MRNLILLAAATLAVAPTAVLAGDLPAQTKNAAVAPAVNVQQSGARLASKAVRMSDAELEKVVAASATVDAGHGITIVFNPGNADVLIRHKRGVTCVNCF